MDWSVTKREVFCYNLGIKKDGQNARLFSLSMGYFVLFLHPF